MQGSLSRPRRLPLFARRNAARSAGDRLLPGGFFVFEDRRRSCRLQALLSIPPIASTMGSEDRAESTAERAGSDMKERAETQTCRGPLAGLEGCDALSSADRPADPARCPLCGQPNGCALTEGRPIESCWCLTARIPEDVLARIPAERRRQACVCSRCAAGEP